MGADAGEGGSLTRCRLYLITPERIDEAFEEALKRALDAGDAATLQLRLKGAGDDEILSRGERLMRIAHAHDVALLVNDRPELARRLGADGVHVGQQDMSCAEARAIAGADRIVGVTCHNSRHLAMEAAEAGADYVAFGAFFPTTTKEAPARAEPEILTWWQQLMTSPCVAIGGITTENAEPLVRAGADFLAVSAGVWNHAGGPAAAVKTFNAIFERAARRA